jgi:hypothetical protein
VRGGKRLQDPLGSGRQYDAHAAEVIFVDFAPDKSQMHESIHQLHRTVMAH